MVWTQTTSHNKGRMSGQSWPARAFHGAKERLQSTLLGTRAVLLLCIGLFVVQVVLGAPAFATVCNSPIFVYYQFGVHRLVTAVFFHVGLLHLVFNMSVWVPVGSRLEQEVGTMSLLWHVLLLGGGANLLNCLVSWAAFYVIGFPLLMFHCDVGLSGVLFALLVWQAHRMPVGAMQNVFGVFTVPARVYPWILLGLTQLMMPLQVSFRGHLAGMAMGYLLAYNYLRWFLPSPQRITQIEQWVPRALWGQDTYLVASDANTPRLPETWARGDDASSAAPSGTPSAGPKPPATGGRTLGGGGGGEGAGVSRLVADGAPSASPPSPP